MDEGNMRYGLLGEKLSHSFSAEIHKSLGGYDYELIEVEKKDLKSFLKKKDFSAINVTIPYKQDVIPYLYYISDTAKAIGAVNTVVNKDGKLYGYNTDFLGMRALILKNGIDLNGKKVSAGQRRHIKNRTCSGKGFRRKRGLSPVEKPQRRPYKL